MSQKIYSILTSRCLRCHVSKIFLNSSSYKYKNWDKMHPDCPTCGLHFEREPGFFQGAMYISYGLAVALSFCADVIPLVSQYLFKYFYQIR